MDKNTPQWQLVANADWLKGQCFPLMAHTVLGRDSSCDITIPGTHLSRRHAELAINGDRLLVRDLNSSNGTFVNGEKVTQAELHPGDQIQFDVLTFTVEGPRVQKPLEANATMIRTDIKAKAKPLSQSSPQSDDLSKEKKWKTKPTSPGNRHDTIQISTGTRAINVLVTAAGVIVTLAALAAVGYLFTQL